MNRENNTGRAGTIYPDARNQNVFWFRMGLKDIWPLMSLVHHQSAVILEKLGVAAIEKEEQNILAHLERLRTIKRNLIQNGDTAEHPMPAGYAVSLRLQFTGQSDRDGGVGFGYYDQHCAGVIRKEMGLPVPHAQQQAGMPRQQPPVAQQWGTPVGIAPIQTQPAQAPHPVQTVEEPAQQQQTVDLKSHVEAELKKAADMNAQMQAMVAQLANVVNSLK